MYVSVVNNDGVTHSPPKYSEWLNHPIYAPRKLWPGYNYLQVKGKDYNSVMFVYHFRESTNDGSGYQTLENFNKQMTEASEDFKDSDFQLVTFNVPEQDRFGDAIKALGFEQVGNNPGNHGTPIYLHVKTKKVAKKKK